MRIVVASDHAAFAMKRELAAWLATLGHQVADVGTHAEVSCDYPDYAQAACRQVLSGEADRAVLVCGTGIGISIAANKVPGMRCALVHDAVTARLAWEHNHAQAIALGARVIGIEVAKSCVSAWLGATFEERHQRRIDKIHALEKPLC